MHLLIRKCIFTMLKKETMEINTELYEKLIKVAPLLEEKCLPSVSIDCVVFGFHDSSLKVLLLKLINSESWAIPGGYVFKDEDMYQSANRILEERTGVKQIFLTQFKTFGQTNRSEHYFAGFPDNIWHKQRFLTIGYYALIDYSKVHPEIDEFSDSCEWKDVDSMPKLMMDHQTIFDEALMQLRRDLNYKPVGLNLLPEKFTMPELQKLYETILGKELNRGNFFRKMKRYGILTKLNETRKGGAHKAPDLYSFNQDTYNKALEMGFQEGW